MSARAPRRRRRRDARRSSDVHDALLLGKNPPSFTLPPKRSAACTPRARAPMHKTSGPMFAMACGFAPFITALPLRLRRRRFSTQKRTTRCNS